jgi:hypothetical protein
LNLHVEITAIDHHHRHCVELLLTTEYRPSGDACSASADGRRWKAPGRL